MSKFKKLAHHRNDVGGALKTGLVWQLSTSQFDPINETGLLPQSEGAPSAGPSAAVTTAAVPLPPAAWMALITIALGLVARRIYQPRQLC